jgi:hypothetical protein
VFYSKLRGCNESSQLITSLSLKYMLTVIPPSSVNLMAFDTKLTKTYVNRALSNKESSGMLSVAFSFK